MIPVGDTTERESGSGRSGPLRGGADIWNAVNHGRFKQSGVKGTVVGTAPQSQISGVCGTIMSVPYDVVTFAPIRWTVAARDYATAIPDRQSALLRRRCQTDRNSQIEQSSLGIEYDAFEQGIAGHQCQSASAYGLDLRAV